MSDATIAIDEPAYPPADAPPPNDPSQQNAGSGLPQHDDGDAQLLEDEDAVGGFGHDDYPGSAAPRNGPWDRWGYAWAQCTSFAMKRVVDELHQGPFLWGDGGKFAVKARAAGKSVDGQPRVHDLVSLPANVGGAGPFGHVAVVLSAPGGGHVWVEDYDWSGPLRYGQHWLPTQGASFIHLEEAPALHPEASLPAFPTIHDVPERFTVRVRLPGLHVRAGPGTNFAVNAPDLPAGRELSCDAWALGTPVPDPSVGNRPDRRWYRMAHLQWVCSALVDGNAPGSAP
jgi:surface antigen